MMCEFKLADKLVELRSAKGVTQEDVARSLSTSNKTISKWETGASMPDLSGLVMLAQYYDISTDALLGLAEEKKLNTREAVCREFEGLDRREAVLKAFETARAMIPAMYNTVSDDSREVQESGEPFPSGSSHYTRLEILHHEFYDFAASSEDVNIAVMLLGNKENFGWLNDPGKQKEIVRFFKFLASEDALSVLYFIHTTDCSESFTADYISENTGVKKERVTEILDEFCAVGECRWATAQLLEGEIRFYECAGDGIVLSAITLAYEKMCGRQFYEYCFKGSGKMIGGK